MWQWMVLSVLVMTTIQAKQITVQTPEAEWSFETNQETPLSTIIEGVEELIDEEDALVIEVVPCKKKPMANKQGASVGQPREYFRSVTAAEIEDLRYIITTLANRPLVSIMMSRNEIEAAGDRIAHLHPLRFLMTIFTDEELKVGIRNIRTKGWVWNQFLAGLKESLSTEYYYSNILNNQVADFSAIVGINQDLIIPSVGAQNWDLLVDLLISHVPRKGDQDRYDM